MQDANPDEVLVNLAGNGDRHALVELFDRHRERLSNFVCCRMDSRLQARVDPSDVLQEAFVDASERVANYAEKSDMPAYLWLRAVTGERLARFYRQHVNAKMRSVDQEVSLFQGSYPNASSIWLADQLVAKLTTASQALTRIETQSAVQQALEQMEPIDREILVLRHFEMLSNSEVAQVLNLSPTAASNRYVRALQRIRPILRESEETNG